jgi:hypothetical protein
VLEKYFKQIVINDASHFDDKGELLDQFKENYNSDEDYNNNINPEFNENIELKVISPPRKFNKKYKKFKFNKVYFNL